MADDGDGAAPLAALVLATGNPGKVAELIDLLGDRYRVMARPADLPDTVEDGDTLEANAIKKAVEVSASTGAAALADDTGLFVDAIGGRPGVRTARYAGPDADDQANRAKLLDELSGVEGAARRAEFRTVVALVRPDGSSLLADGRVEGVIADAVRGERGFGYDPLFVPVEGDGRTFAEMALDEKQALSHRARALTALLDRLA
ncbi:MAG: RdgB/HAM1 family non-canonical purine NTP pyrophosphatase [Actinomycetota bacterium]